MYLYTESEHLKATPDSDKRVKELSAKFKREFYAPRVFKTVGYNYSLKRNCLGYHLGVDYLSLSNSIILLDRFEKNREYGLFSLAYAIGQAFIYQNGNAGEVHDEVIKEVGLGKLKAEYDAHFFEPLWIIDSEIRAAKMKQGDLSLKTIRSNKYLDNALFKSDVASLVKGLDEKEKVALIPIIDSTIGMLAGRVELKNLPISNLPYLDKIADDKPSGRKDLCIAAQRIKYCGLPEMRTDMIEEAGAMWIGSILSGINKVMHQRSEVQTTFLKLKELGLKDFENTLDIILSAHDNFEFIDRINS